MAKKSSVEVSLLPDQIKMASKVFDTTADVSLKDRDTWKLVIDLIDSDPTGALKKELSTLCKQRFLIAWRVKFGRDLTLEEIDRCKKSASVVFSEYTANGGKAATRSTRKTAAELEAEKQTAIAEALKAAGKTEASTITANTASLAAPSTVRKVEELRDAMNVVQANLMAYQTELSAARVGVQIKTKLGESIGLITQQIADASNQVAEVLALLG